MNLLTLCFPFAEPFVKHADFIRHFRFHISDISQHQLLLLQHDPKSYNSVPELEASSYSKLPKVTQDYPRLPKITQDYPRLPRLPKITQGYPRLPKVSQGYPRLPKVPQGFKALHELSCSSMTLHPVP